MKKLIKNTTSETYCMRYCCQDTPKRAVHAEGGAVSINTDVKSEDTEITDTRNQRHVITVVLTLSELVCNFYMDFLIEKNRTGTKRVKSGIKLSPRRQIEIFVPRFNLCT